MAQPLRELYKKISEQSSKSLKSSIVKIYLNEHLMSKAKVLRCNVHSYSWQLHILTGERLTSKGSTF